jgi:transposase
MDEQRSCELCGQSLCDEARPEDKECCGCIRHNFTLQVERVTGILECYQLLERVRVILEAAVDAGVLSELERVTRDGAAKEKTQ